MGALKDAVAAQGARKGPLCRVATARATMKPADQADLAELLVDQSVPGSVLADQLTKLTNIRVSADSLRRHRMGRCACR
jgi:hypothetical protein